MLKKLFYVGLVTSTLFAQEEIITPKIEMKLTLNDNAKLLVDCSYTEEKKFGFIGGIFASKKYANDENDKTIRSLMNIVCKDTYPEMREVSLKDLYKAAKTVQADTGNDFDLRTNERISNNSLDNPIYFVLRFSDDRLFNNDYIAAVSFLVTSMENNNLTVVQDYISNYDLFSREKEQNYLIKTYQYDYQNKKVISLETDKPLNVYLPIAYTNTYNIDELTECIDGKIWIKKYGNTAGDKCKWAEKVTGNKKDNEPTTQNSPAEKTMLGILK